MDDMDIHISDYLPHGRTACFIKPYRIPIYKWTSVRFYEMGLLFLPVYVLGEHSEINQRKKKKEKSLFI